MKRRPMPDPIAALQAGMLEQIAALMDARDYLGPAEWQRQFEALIVEQHAAAYFAGQGTNTLTARGDRELGALMQSQFDYLAGFAADVDQLSDAQARARAALYAGPLRATYSHGQLALWDLPYHPGEGTPCRGNCHCRWRIVVEDLEELNARAYWELGATEHCDECKARARRRYIFRGGVLQ